MSTHGQQAFRAIWLWGLLVLSWGWTDAERAVADDPALRQKAMQEMTNGNFRDAYEGLSRLCLDPTTDPRQLPMDLANASQMLLQLGEVAKFDGLIEGTIEAHPTNWRLLRKAAELYRSAEHNGFVIGGEYRRGWSDGQGRVVNTFDRDWVRSLQLLERARVLAVESDDKGEVAEFFMEMAGVYRSGGPFGAAWRLQILTDLSTLPEPAEGYAYGGDPGGAPVDESGEPIVYREPASWEAAINDGERWRWALAQAVENSPKLADQAKFEVATFARDQFDVQTMQQFRWFRPFEPSGDGEAPRTYDLDTLTDDETIARLANGIRRFKLPEGYNHLLIFQELAENAGGTHQEAAHIELARVYENRRQYTKAADWWKRCIEKFGPGQGDWRQQALLQIEGNWGTIEPPGTLPAGKKASFEFRFRNAKRVDFVATPINVSLLIDDIRAYLKSNPEQLDWSKVQIENLGYRLVNEDMAKYLQGEKTTWGLDLEPRAGHYDRRITVESPQLPAGAYLVESQVADGNASRFVMWIADSVIVQKQLDNQILFFVADALTGAPLARMDVEFLGYRVEQIDGGRRPRILTSQFVERTDADGLVLPRAKDLDTNHQWLTVARSADGRLAFFGFRGIWTQPIYDERYEATKALVITDRPVYRPGHAVQFKVWVGQTKYDAEGGSPFAGAAVPLRIMDPEGNVVFERTLTADEYGGVADVFEVPEAAKLGQYSIFVDLGETGGNTFRVEEYRKPEFEVLVEAPAEPVMLGETIKAKVKARYYFGAPVSEGTVSYKITRSEMQSRWYPIAPWDWCYGPGYWWFAYDYPWYPGFRDWVGCVKPAMPGIWFPPGPPPEIVAQAEVPLNADGTIEIEIDTQIAKELLGKSDHRYSITAEVRDSSRRVISGTGEVLAARKPFTIYTWLERGHYRVGEDIEAHLQARTLDGKPVKARGEWTLLKIAYDDARTPIETPVSSWAAETDVEGRADLKFAASSAGQYRLRAKLTDSAGHEIEGAFIFTVRGEGFDGRDYRFNAVELIPDRREYAPGETVELQINTDQIDSTVLLFLRPVNGVALKPQVLRLKGRSAVERFEITKRDMPNCFVEVVTVSQGRVHTEVRELVVPPEERVLQVEVLPSAERYRPGDKAKVQLQLTDHTGENFKGSTVVAIYDKSLEAVVGGTNTPDIREFFWKWRRNHQPQTLSSLDRWEGLVYRDGDKVPQPIGVFGATVADDFDAMGLDKSAVAEGGFGGPRFAGGAGGMGGAIPMAAMARGGAPMEAMAMADGAPMGPGGPVSGAPADAAGGGGWVEPTVRKNFLDTALWVARVDTDDQGRAEVELSMPENLTTWKVKVWGMGTGTRVGAGEKEVVTGKDLLIRMQTPRFLIEKDEVVLSGIVHNYLATEKTVQVALELPSENLVAIDPLTVDVVVPANGEVRVDWRVKVEKEGDSTLRMFARTDEESDAMELVVPVRIHGAPKMESWAGTIRPEAEQGEVKFVVPSARRVADSRLEVRYSPTLAGAMVDALPYLADYPYGCTEQTLNRWLPAVITQRVLIEMGVDLAEVEKHQTNLNAQELGDAAERKKRWKRFDRNPVFDRAEVDRMVRDGIAKLAEMQVSDGGWGWFSGYGERSWPHTTAVVVHGLQVARENDVPLPPGMLERGIAWLTNYRNEQLQRLENAKTKTEPFKTSADELDSLVHSVLVDEGLDEPRMLEFLYRDRNGLSVYSKTLVALVCHRVGDAEKLAMLRRNIEQFLVQDAENETAYLKMPEGNSWWYWYGDEIEANAAYLKLLSKVDPRGQVAPRMVKYLLNNRKHATYWNSTRDTAMCVESFASYLRATDEMRPDMTVEVWLDGEKRKEVAINAKNLFTFDNAFVLEGDQVTDGEHRLELRRKGSGPVYFNTYVEHFSLEDRILAAGLEVKIDRRYYRLVPKEKSIASAGDRGQVLDRKIEAFDRIPIENLATVTSGDLIEVELIVESKNDYEYLMFEDPKPAGCEPLATRSGYDGNSLGAYVEYRDEKVSFFVQRLERGRHALSYRLRAETPGQFSALPAQASAMYAPELRGNSDELRLIVQDKPE